MKHMQRLTRKYILADIVMSIVAWLLFCAFRWVANDILVFNDIPILTPNFNFFLSITFFPLCNLFTSYITGFYDQSSTRSRITELIATLVSTFASTLITFFAILLDDIVASYYFYYHSFLVLWATTFVTTYATRACITINYFSKIHGGKIKFNLLIIGTGASATNTANSIMNKRRFYGANFVGFVRANRNPKTQANPVLGSLQHIDSIIKTHNIQTIIIALNDEDEDMTYDIINRLIKYRNIEINLVPRQTDIITGRITLGDVDSVPLINLSSIPMPPWQRSVKRLFDIVVSSIAIVLLSPLFVYVAIRIKLDSKGPVFYTQQRIGKNGKPFTIYKFRSMKPNAESSTPKLTQKHDARITHYGKIIRKYRIDELPQLFNIIKGDMSIVGPRPERAYFIQQIEEEAPYYCLLYKIQPGLLSWGPIKVGYTHTVEEMHRRLNFDIIYMENMSLINDLKIIAYSIEIVCKGKGV